MLSYLGGMAAPDAGDDLVLEDKPAGTFLTEARNALTSCGDPGKLYGARRTVGISERERTEMHLRAEGRQIDLSRRSILFSALAAEAFVNAALSEALTDSDFDGLDKLAPANKFILGSRLAFEKDLFPRGSEPSQALEDLFKVRNRLVHAKPRRLTVDRGSLADPRYGDYNPPAAARYLVAVAEAARTLSLASGSVPDTIVESICTEAEQFRAFGESLREKLPPPKERYKTRVVKKRGPPSPAASTLPRSLLEFSTHLRSLAGTATAPAYLRDDDPANPQSPSRPD
jgi:hypothetical protein